MNRLDTDAPRDSGWWTGQALGGDAVLWVALAMAAAMTIGSYWIAGRQ